MPIWIGSPTDVRIGKQALKSLEEVNDIQYEHDGEIAEVPQLRWEQAQKYELDAWMKHRTQALDDRSQEHKTNFNNYIDLPNDLGNLIEIGCGPFTQTKIIMQNRTTTHITLLDPLIEQYKKHPNCTYKNFNNLTLISEPAEHLNLTGYDTLISINVLEHVQDANKILKNIVNALKPNGILIFNDRSYDDRKQLSEIYDAGHPIRIKKNTITEFLQKFKQIYYLEKPHYSPEIQANLGLNHYFIGKKL